MLETQVRSSGWEDPLEEMATHYSTLAWRISWTEERERLQSMESQRIGHNCVTKFFTIITAFFFLELTHPITLYSLGLV